MQKLFRDEDMHLNQCPLTEEILTYLEKNKRSGLGKHSAELWERIDDRINSAKADNSPTRISIRSVDDIWEVKKRPGHESDKRWITIGNSSIRIQDSSLRIQEVVKGFYARMCNFLQDIMIDVAPGERDRGYRFESDVQSSMDYMYDTEINCEELAGEILGVLHSINEEFRSRIKTVSIEGSGVEISVN
jgi:hypothetical protein